jgi:hypothetical protein
MSNPKNSEENQAIPEEVGEDAARRLLEEIYKVGFYYA